MIFELYNFFCLGTMQLCHIDGWITLPCDQHALYCSGLFCSNSARCLPLVVRCGADDSFCDVAKEPRGFLKWKKGSVHSIDSFRDVIS